MEEDCNGMIGSATNWTISCASFFVFIVTICKDESSAWMKHLLQCRLTITIKLNTIRPTYSSLVNSLKNLKM